MLKIFFVSKDGSKITAECNSGDNVLDIAKKNNVDIDGLCEGSLACSTCHVSVDDKYYNKLPSAVEDEEDILDLVQNLSPTSRLSCQLIMADELDGLTLYLDR